MPIDMTCPKCGLALRIPDKYAGSTRTCHGCGATFQVPASDAKAVTVSTPVPPQPQSLFRARGDSSAAPALQPVAFPKPAPAEEVPVLLGPEWRPVEQGLNFLQAGLLASLLGVVAGFADSLFHLTTVAKTAGGEQVLNVTSDWWLWLFVSSFPTLVAFLLFIHGRLLCARVPSRLRCRGFAVGSVLATTGTLLGWVAFLFGGVLVAVGEGQSLEGLFLLGVGVVGVGLIGLTAEVLFLCYLSRFARLLNSKPLGQAVGRFVSLAIGMIGISLIVGCLRIAKAGPAPKSGTGAGPQPESVPMLGLVQALGAFTVAVALLMGYRALLNVARRAVQESLALGEAGSPR